MARRSMATLAAIICLLIVSTGVASAHANLLSANIKNNQVLHAGHVPTRIVGNFAEVLDPKQSWMAVFEGVADHGLVTEKHSKVNFRNPHQMFLALPKLAPDKYYLVWYTHSAADGHYAAGILYFQVVK